MQGKIVKGIAGFYYVHVVESGVYECKAKGVFRKEKIKPLVGDNVEIEVLDESEKKGNIVKILPRQNELIRPAVANIDQALVVFAITKPNPHFNLLDRFLVMMESKEIPVVLCFNKEDIATDPQKKELEEIFIRTYGKVERKGGLTPKTYESEYAKKQLKKEEAMQEYLLVDGYNVIFAWEELKELAKVSIEAARDKLMDILCNYQGYKKCVLILVFDAYKVEGYALEIQKYHNIHVVYTKEAETADQYIEKVVHHIGRKYHVTVVTSDGVEQVITMGQGGTRISSRDFLEEIEYTRKLIEEDNEKQRVSDRNYLFDHADEEFVKKMEKIRLGKETE